jgi:hypothetical protein
LKLVLHSSICGYATITRLQQPRHFTHKAFRLRHWREARSHDASLINQELREVPFYAVGCLLWANCGHWPSLDHLVGGRDKIGWKHKAKGICSTEIDDEIELRAGVDGKSARVGSAKDTIDVASS